MNASQLREEVIKPVLHHLDPLIPYSETAVELLMMTAAHESLLGQFLVQVRGPALGIYQMEPATEDDIWNNFLKHRDPLMERVKLLMMRMVNEEDLCQDQLIGNLYYATAMARVHYWRVPEALPSGNIKLQSTIKDLAAYAKKYYNTELGKATEDDYYAAYVRRCI